MSFLDRLLLKWTTGSRDYRAAGEAIQYVLSLSLEQVKPRALHLLANSELFETRTNGPTGNPLIDELGPSLREFFSRYDSVARVHSEFAVARQEVRPSLVRPDFLRIGTDLGDAEIIVRRGEDALFSINTADDPLDGYPTIYHTIYMIGVNLGYIQINSGR